MSDNLIIVDTNAAFVARRISLHNFLLNRRLHKVALEVSAYVGDLYRKTANTWTVKPEFYAQGSYDSATRTLVIRHGTHNKVWKWIDRGTREHIIRAKNAPMLRFMSEYHPKTAPWRLTSVEASYGGNLVTKEEVTHLGVTPRHWTETIYNRTKAKVESLGYTVVS